MEKERTRFDKICRKLSKKEKMDKNKRKIKKKLLKFTIISFKMKICKYFAYATTRDNVCT